MEWPPLSPRSIDFANSTVGYGRSIPSNNEALVKTNNGGTTWSIETASPPRLFTAMAFSRTLGIAAYDTYTGTQALTELYRSSTGGRSWQSLSTMLGITVSAVKSLGGQEWALQAQPTLGSYTRVEISHDNGKHWSKTGLRVPAGTLTSMVSNKAIWVFSNPPKTSASRTGRLRLESFGGTMHNAVLSFPVIGSKHYLVNGLDFLNAWVGWVSATEYVE